LGDFEVEQRDYFDIDKHQYSLDAIHSPPLHAAIELDRVVNALGANGSGQQVLDFGAGTGRLTVALLNRHYTVHAVDLSESSLARLREVVQTRQLAPVTTSTALPDSGLYAAVVGADVLHHVDMNHYLPKIRMLLGSRGKLVFTEPGGLNPAWYVYLSIFHSMSVERRIVFNNVWYLRRALRQSGFHNVKVTGIGLFPRPMFGKNARLCDWHDRLGNMPVLRWFAYRYLIEAEA